MFRPAWKPFRPLAGVLLLSAALPGCESAARQRTRLTSLNPLDRVQAAVRLTEAGDAGAVHRLVSLLADRDVSVRMYAILALERLTGQTFGYRYHAPEGQRAAAIARWRAALQAGQVSLRPPDAPPASPPATADSTGGPATGESEPTAHEP